MTSNTPFQYLKRGLTLLALFLSLHSFAQPDDEGEDLLDLLGEEETIDYASATFKSTRVINGHSIENAAGGVMDFRISHRFGFVNTGAYDFFGLDQAYMRLGFEYGITDRLMAGIGRSNYGKIYDSFIKYKLLRQSTGKRNMPISITLFSSINCSASKWAEPDRENYFSSRLSYAHQILIGRKFNDKLSLQLSPTLVHRNLVATPDLKHDIYALGLGGRYKLTQRLSINAEYFYVPDAMLDPNTYNSFSVGVDLETGGHVFQLHFTNSTSMVEPGFITQTVGQWGKGDIHFGFNVSRVFTVVRKKSPEEK